MTQEREERRGMSASLERRRKERKKETSDGMKEGGLVFSKAFL